MIKRLPALILFLQIACSPVWSQTVFWYDNFDLPAGGAINNNAGIGWTLNNGGSGSNQWYINSGSGVACGSANGLHISCTGFACSLFGGPNAPVYNASVTSNRTAESPVISTVGRTGIILSFSWTCFGEPGYDYGSIAFSSDGGVSWASWPSDFSGSSGCSTFSVNLPAEYENIPNFRIRFRWQNDFSDGADPAFLVDNIQLVGVEQACVPPTVDAGQSAIFCEGGFGIGIGGFPTAVNGSGNYSYSWSPATGLNDPTASNPIAIPSVTTNYTVTVTDLDNNCSATDDVLVTVLPQEELLTTPAGTIVTCDDDDILISATSGFSNYVWTGPTGNVSGQSIMASEPGVYQVSATGSNGCPTVSEEVEIILVSPQAIGVTASGSLQLCAGEQVTLTAQSGFSNYEWNGPEGEVSGISASAGTAGDWYVTATDANGCETVSAVQQVSILSPVVL
ncbi:MAG: hypothetical protein KDC13_04335, partial [Bacteroidetes bacterium]|nr:hypothetical protein [Bacteroidota bacterium]